MQTFTALLQGPRPPAVAVQQTYVRCNHCSCSAIAVVAVPLTRNRRQATTAKRTHVRCNGTNFGLCPACITNPGTLGARNPELDF